VRESEQESTDVGTKKTENSSTPQGNTGMPKQNRAMPSKVKNEKDGNAIKNPTIPIKSCKINMQKFCDVLQVKKTRSGRLKYFRSCVPIFLMCGSEEVLSSKSENNACALILTSETGKITAILTDFLLSGSYLISRLFSSEPLSSCTIEFAKEFPESYLTLQAVTLSPYLSSPTDPMDGHHFIMVGHMRDDPIDDIYEENTDHNMLETVVDEFEMSNKCEDQGFLFVRRRCDHLYYCMIMTVIRKVNVHCMLQTRKKKFQMRIKFVDDFKMKQKKKKKSDELQKEEDAIECEGMDEESLKDL
jgi:hypothetical protein